MRAFLAFLVFVLVQGVPESNRIIGGEDASVGEFPWMASLKYNGFHFCGGTLIAKQWVLTAAHCLDEAISELFVNEVVLGEHDLTKDEGTEVQAKIAQKIIHPEWTYKDGHKKNDIALVRLEEPVTFTDVIQPIGLPEAKQESTGGVVASGWGGTSWEGDANPILQKVSFHVVDDDTCKYKYDMDIFDYNICAGNEKAGTSECPGDSGGPLLCDNMSYVCGVSSWIYTRYECGEGPYPNVFTQVSYFVDWIQFTMSKYE